MSADIYTIAKRAAEDAAAEVLSKVLDHYSGVVPEWLSPADAATYLGFTEQTLADWRSGRCMVPGFPNGPTFTKLAGKSVRYRRRDLDGFMEQFIVNPAGD